MTWPAASVAVTRTWLVRRPGARTSACTSISASAGAVDTNWVVIHSGARSETSSAAVIDTAIAVPP